MTARNGASYTAVREPERKLLKLFSIKQLSESATGSSTGDPTDLGRGTEKFKNSLKFSRQRRPANKQDVAYPKL